MTLALQIIAWTAGAGITGIVCGLALVALAEWWAR